ncbi:MAG: DUF2283 domain-containing protein [Caldilineaceae bacterium]|jgi:YD repeat-containing protein
MDELNLQRYQVITESGRPIEIEYDQDGDMLEIFFQKGPATNAIELAAPIILRFDRESGMAVSLSILTFSRVIEKTELGPRSFRIDGLDALPDALRKIVSNIITSPPVSTFLKVSTYYPQTEQRPVALSYLERSVALPLAA